MLHHAIVTGRLDCYKISGRVSRHVRPAGSQSLNVNISGDAALSRTRLYDDLRRTAIERTEAVVQLTSQICQVAAPTGGEYRRATVVANEFRQRGYEPQIDAIGNVYARRGRGSGNVLMLAAHTDTVFPSTESIKVIRGNGLVRGAGIGDNSLGVAAMLAALDILDDLAIETPTDVVAVANVGEEGLGNLRGIREAVRRYSGSIGAAIAIEGHNLGRVTNVAVGSRRWRLIVRGPGGHSWGAFGQPSAIHGIAQIVSRIAEIEVPRSPRTTFNVGLIEGGTSVNTIASKSSAVIDMRSTDAVELERLADRVQAIVERSLPRHLTGDIEVLGERPAGVIDQNHPLVLAARRSLYWLGLEATLDASSTDANIPLSVGIPAICVGITRGGRGHTVDEYIQVSPIAQGVAQLTRLVVDVTEMIAAGGLNGAR